MKTVLLLRHGKSDWDAEFGEDHERPLALRGRKAAVSVGRFLSATDQVPGRVLTSSAVRAADTVARAAEAGNWSCPIEIAPELYHGGVEEIIVRIHRESDAVESLLLTGHEPTWSSLATELIGGGQLRFPTAALARIDLYVERWADLRPACGELVWFVAPRLLRRLGIKDRKETC